MDCAEFGVLCREAACFDSGGDQAGDSCLHAGADFDSLYYENATAECGIMEQRCVDTGGMVAREGSCCLPSFALLLVLGCAVRSRRFK